jgi:hypothetical protein
MSDEELGALDNDYDYKPAQPRNRGIINKPDTKPVKQDSFEEIE